MTISAKADRLLQLGQMLDQPEERTAGMYDNKFNEAVKRAKAHWGAGWQALSEEMRDAYVSYYLAGLLAAIDFEDAIGDKVTTELEKKLLTRLIDLTAVLHRKSSL